MAEPTRSGRPCAQRQLAASKSTANLATSSGEILEWVKGYGHSPSKTAVRGTQYPPGLVASPTLVPLSRPLQNRSGLGHKAVCLLTLQQQQQQ
ncbi:hypothetical protein CEP54_003322 [Fusarium duplospermum]|uniref:Uncharacterized protein n=1 Tax=Fusarium duplospermum TaxID=1325734 RepID=A0A428QPN1_9HYPO|nr:hypothetical protein CEP54_003322 [Fusarium duplospermum]